MASMLFAHQGGWDEVLFALIPLAVVALLLLLANKRANAAQRRHRVPFDETPTGPDNTDRPTTH